MTADYMCENDLLSTVRYKISLVKHETLGAPFKDFVCEPWAYTAEAVNRLQSLGK